MSIPNGAVANHAHVGINTALNQKHVDGIIGLAGSGIIDNAANQINTGNRTVLGDEQNMGHLMSVGRADIHESAPHQTTSLGYAINGTAKVFADTVTAWMANYVEPMKVIMGTMVVNEETVIITREYLVGGGCQITAERALAPTISLKEDQRKVVLNTYGADIMINNDLAHKPALMFKQMSMLMGGQRQHLEDKATQIMYRCVMQEGTSLIAAYQRASAASGHKSALWRQLEANRLYMGQQFAALNKWQDPMRNLLAALAKANKYTPTSGTEGMNVMIAPADFLHTDLTRPSKMYYYVSGVSDGSKPPVKTPMPNTMMLKEAENLRVMIHHARPSFGGPGGTANPQVMWNHLAREESIAIHYPLDERTFTTTEENPGRQGWSFGITNFKTQAWQRFKLPIARVSENLYRSLFSPPRNAPYPDFLEYDQRNGFTIPKVFVDGARGIAIDNDQGEFLSPDLDGDEGDEELTQPALGSAGGRAGRVKVDVALYRPNFVLRTLSAIFSAGTGAEIGAFLVAYPKTMIASTQFTQMTRIGLRIAFGAALFARERVIIMESVLLDGCVKGHGCRLSQSTTKFVDAVEDEQYAMLQRGSRGHDLFIGIKLHTTEDHEIWKDPLWIASQIRGPYSHYLRARATYQEHRATDIQPDWPKDGDVTKNTHQGNSRMGNHIPSLFPRGTVCNESGAIVHLNNGHLGRLDTPTQVPNINGMQHPHPEDNLMVQVAK